jgi:desulfoferrodoxin (superoxide reductase-like protein)
MRIFLFILFSLLISFSGFGHPPEKIGIRANLLDKKIDIIAEHPLDEPNKHYIKRIEVILNGRKIISQDFLLQTGDIQHASYIVEGLKKGDILEVEAECNLSGSLHNKITVE